MTQEQYNELLEELTRSVSKLQTVMLATIERIEALSGQSEGLINRLGVRNVELEAKNARLRATIEELESELGMSQLL